MYSPLTVVQLAGRKPCCSVEIAGSELSFNELNMGAINLTNNKGYQETEGNTAGTEALLFVL